MVCNGPQTAQTVSQMAQTVENGIKSLENDWKMKKKKLFWVIWTLNKYHKRYA
jgi:hypothetical protein